MPLPDFQKSLNFQNGWYRTAVTMQNSASTNAARRSCQPNTMQNGAMASTMIAPISSAGPLHFGRNDESACAIASFQNTILSSALNGNSATRHTRITMG